MLKLSPHYRMDNNEGLPVEVQKYLDEHFLAHLPHLQKVHPKLLIVFSGGSAVGKSSLSHFLQSELKALVLENDAIKLLLQKMNPHISQDELNRYTWQYTMNLYQHLAEISPNGLVVRDGVIDWYYDRILPTFIAQGYELFIIAYDLTHEKRVELIKKRGDMPNSTVERFIELLEDHEIHIKRFRSNYSPDVLLNDHNLFDFAPIAQQIRARLKQ